MQIVANRDRPKEKRLAKPRPQKQEIVSSECLAVYDATPFVGLRTIVYGAAIKRVDKQGQTTIELPHLRQLAASAAVSRCLKTERLRGPEIRAIRRTLKLTLAELANALDPKTALETVSRWESGAQWMGVYAERALRLLVCERLTDEAPGVDYRASKISELRIEDPWKADPDFEMPPIEFHLIKMKTDGSLIDAWNTKEAA